MRFVRAGFFVFFALTLQAIVSPPLAVADTVANQQAALQAELNQINQQIAQNQTKLAAEQKQRTSLENEVEILNSQIEEAQLEIRQRDLTIQQLKDGISQKQAGIASLDTQVAAGQASLAQILRETNEMDRTSLAAQVLGGTLEDVFRETDDFHTIQQALGNAFTQMAAQKSDLSAREVALEAQQQEQSDLLQLQVAQQNSLKATEAQKEQLVAAAKGQEAIYQQIIASQQQTAAQIKQALFALNGANHSTSFGDMYQYAQEASAITGVAPSFILGILSEESNLGQNVGTGNWKTDMSPANQPLFAALCQELGLDPDTQPVSKKPWYGWGGAMGPAQFIPSTWNLYVDRIAHATGQSVPNPWDPRTATFAAAILLSDNGADTQTAAAERLAALRYLAGWKNASNPAYAFYGNDVMCLTQKMQQQIDVLNGNLNPGPPISC